MANPLPSLRKFVENNGYEVVTMSDGHPSAVPMKHEPALAELERAERLHYALQDILDAAERARAGFPIESEEWYARRDYARVQLAGGGG